MQVSEKKTEIELLNCQNLREYPNYELGENLEFEEVDKMSSLREHAKRPEGTNKHLAQKRHNQSIR